MLYEIFLLCMNFLKFKDTNKNTPIYLTRGFTPTPQRGEVNNSLKKNIAPHLVCGFTLVEMMIVVGLIAVFTAIGLGTGRDTNDRVVFFRDQAKVVQAVYQAREFTMATKGNYCGYGIQAQNGVSTISIVRVLRDANNICYTGTDANPHVLLSQIDPTLERTISLDTQVFVPPPSGQLTFLFLAPFNGQAIFPSNASPCFVLTSPKGFASSTVRINGLGQPQVSSTPCN